MKTNESDIWFPAKRYGWGWGPPCRWQGWVVMGVWFAAVAVGVALLLPQHIVWSVAYLAVLMAVFTTIVVLKGEKPGWRWGDSQSPAKSTAEKLSELEDLRRRQLVSDMEYEAKRQEILKSM